MIQKLCVSAFDHHAALDLFVLESFVLLQPCLQSLYLISALVFRV